MWPKNQPLPISDRVSSLPPYIFHTLKGWEKEVAAQGHTILPLSMGSPDQHPPAFVVDAMCEAVKKGTYDPYGPFEGFSFYLEAAAQWIKERFGVHADPKKHLLLLIGSKEGISNLPRALCNPGDSVLIPDPGYPAYQTSLYLAQVNAQFFTIHSGNDFAPEFSELKKLKQPKTKIIYLNYPSNPTARLLSRQRFQELVGQCLSLGLAVAHDNPYSELYRGTEAPPSALEFCDLNQDPVIEFFSFSKMMNMGGWRIGFAVGNESIISALRTVKTHMDTGQFGAIQWAAAAALRQQQPRTEHLNFMRTLYDKRYEAALAGLKENGFDTVPPQGTFYLWVRTPKDIKDMEWTRSLLWKGHIVVTPGSAFGPSGENWFRMTMTHNEDVLRQLGSRMAKVRGELP